MRLGFLRNKQLFIDEAWGLLENEESTKFLETGYWTYRKLNAGIICITQNPEVDLLQNPSGRAIILENAVQIDPVTHGQIVQHVRGHKPKGPNIWCQP